MGEAFQTAVGFAFLLFLYALPFLVIEIIVRIWE